MKVLSASRERIRQLTVHLVKRTAICLVAVSLMLLSCAPSSVAQASFFSGGIVRLAACHGASAEFAPLSREEQNEDLGNIATVLHSTGGGKAGVVFIPHYDQRPTGANSTDLQFVDILFKANEQSQANATLNFCFDSSSKPISFPLNRYRSQEVELGWRFLRIDDRRIGLTEASQLNKMTISLSGSGDMIIGDVSITFGPPNSRFFGKSTPDLRLTIPKKCEFLSDCSIPLEALRTKFTSRLQAIKQRRD